MNTEHTAGAPELPPVDPRQRAADALRASEEQLRGIIEHSPLSMAIVCPDGTIEYFNRRAAETFGYLPADIPTMAQWWERACPDPVYRAEVVAQWTALTEKAVAEGREIERREYRVTCKDRGTKTMVIFGMPISGKLFVMFEDITAHKRAAETALRDSEAPYRTLFETSIDAIMTLEPPSWRFTTGNPATVRLFGTRDEAEFISKEPWRLSPERQPDGRPSADKAKEMIEIAMRDGSNFFEWTHRRTDGTDFPATVLLTRVPGARHTFLQATVRDITAQKKAETLLRNSEMFLSTVIEENPASTCILDAQGTLLRMNRACRDLLAGCAGDAIGRYNLLDDETVVAQGCGARVRKVFENGEVVRFEIDYRPSASQPRVLSPAAVLDVTVFPIKDATGSVTHVVVQYEDITQRKRAEADLVRAKEVAEEANRAKSQFLATMSHELRTPLNPILGFTALLAEAKNLTDEQRVWLHIVGQRGRDLLALIDSVLDLSKIEAGKVTLVRSELRLPAMVQEMAGSFQPAIEGKGLRLETHIAPGLPEVVQADGLRLRQILLNLVANAIKFTSSGGIVLRVEEGRTSPLRRPPAGDEAALRFSVQDTGIGIAADRQGRIFETFEHADYQHAVKYGGAGLGLAIVKRLVELMDGRIWVESREGAGSTFVFTLLVGARRGGVAAPAAVAGAGAGEPRARLRILVVEDDSASRFLAERLVVKLGHAVRTAENGLQALALLETESFDLILMDLRMPVLDGVETARAIRARDRAAGRHTTIIALTAHAMGGDQERCLAEGMDGYLSKPISKDSLAAVLDAAAGRRG